MQTYILTIPRTVPKKVLKIMIAENDCKRWVIGWETGHGGYKHYQVRLETSNAGFFLWCKTNIPSAHIEQSKTWSDYERKDGYFISSNDTTEIRKVRFGTPEPNQLQVLRDLRTQSVREIDVYLDKRGGRGKTWLSIHLWELGRAILVPRSAISSNRLEGFLVDAYSKRWYDIIIVDIPRAAKIPADLYESLEEIKDGLLSDWRYSTRQINIRGCKVLVFTNTELDTKKLSADRWRLHGIGSLLS